MAIEMEIYKQIRHLREHENLSQRQVSEHLQISRNTVRRYWDGDKVPWERKEGSGRKNDVITNTVVEFVRHCLEEDAQHKHKKQRHTAHRIYTRLVAEKGYSGSESGIRSLVAELKQQPQNAFIPLEYYPGEAIQVDWGEATAYLSGNSIKVQIWCMRECYSDDYYCRAFLRQNEESFLEGMRDGLEYFGGAPRRIIFDNAKIAVKEGFGPHAKATDKYFAMSAHYAFTPVFCNIASGNEKGLVEGLVGFVRRNALVPIPKVKSIDDLNDILIKNCLDYRSHKVTGKELSVGEMVSVYREQLTPLPPYRYDTSRTLQPKVDEFALIRFDYNRYSVPYIYCGKNVTAKGMGNTLEIYYRGETIASYIRDYAREKSHYTLEHYIELIARKPRSACNAAPVRQNVPADLMAFLNRLSDPKEVVRVIRMYIEYGDELLHALSGVCSAQTLEAKLVKVFHSDSTEVESVRVIVPDLHCYDLLMKGGEH